MYWMSKIYKSHIKARFIRPSLKSLMKSPPKTIISFHYITSLYHIIKLFLFKTNENVQ